MCLVDTHTEACAASRTYFYGSGIWVNILKERYNAFSTSSAIVNPNFESRNLLT